MHANLGILIRLRAETAELHQRVEAELDLFDARTSWLDYRLFLFRMYGFHVPVEQALSVAPGLDRVVGDIAQRTIKAPLLANDLLALGVDRRDLARLPSITAPVLDDLPEALGWLYVVEQTTLDGKTLRAHLASRLPLELEIASSYLGCYGDDAAARWRDLGAAIEAYATQTGTGDRIVAAASECLLRLHRWLRPASLPAPSARGAAVAG